MNLLRAVECRCAMLLPAPATVGTWAAPPTCLAQLNSAALQGTRDEPPLLQGSNPRRR
jgi:hypothetical protein